ncbi:MAG: Crp/Fnr family transcriptional regulator [Bacteroidetes bacterium]|nr:Crp/Fnr family transcriptional regulator [Bacteroidota bacterium]
MLEYLGKSSMSCFNCELKSSLFSMLDEVELGIIEKNRLSVVFKAGETIRKQGTQMTHVLSVNSGMAKLYLEGIENRNAILRIVKPTNFIGGPGIYLDQMHHYTVMALMESSVCFIDLNAIKEVIRRNNHFAEEFMKDFSRNTLNVYNRLIYLTQKQMPGRMADSLLYLFEDIFESDHFPMLLTRQDLADLSAMSRDSALKILRSFQHDGIIQFDDKELKLLDHESLRKISRIG